MCGPDGGGRPDYAGAGNRDEVLTRSYKITKTN